MGRTILVNGARFDVSQSSLTGGQLKQQLQFSPDSLVAIPGPNGDNLFIGDGDYLPADATEVVIIPKFEYGR
jgi:hypothetical protein